MANALESGEYPWVFFSLRVLLAAVLLKYHLDFFIDLIQIQIFYYIFFLFLFLFVCFVCLFHNFCFQLNLIKVLVLLWSIFTSRVF